MQQELKIITEGVLVLASANALTAEYNDKAFDYDFPEGLEKLINENEIIALLTSSGDILNIKTQVEQPLDRTKFDTVLVQQLKFSVMDALLIMSHADFTMICDQGGNYMTYFMPLKFVEPLFPGNYEFEIGIKNVEDEFEKYQACFELTINISRFEGEMKPNAIVEIED